MPTLHPSFPTYIRVPRVRERCPVTGLCRSTIWSLIAGASPRVKSKIVRQPGASRGIRLVCVSSLLEAIESSEVVESRNVEVVTGNEH